MKTTIHEKVRAALVRDPLATDRAISKNIGCRVADVVAVRRSGSAQNGSEETVATLPLPGVSLPLPGVSLTNRNVLPRRPPESAAKFIRRLPNNRGFDPKELSRQWGMSEDTIKRHAKDLGCLKYVEVQPDEWVAMVMNPETAARYH